MIRHPVPRARTYVGVWLGLLALLGLSLGSAYLPLGWGNAAVSLGVALAKALLVLSFFMHLRSAHGTLRLAAAAGFLWLAILIGLALTDFVAR